MNVHARTFIDYDEGLPRLVADGLISKREHPEAALSIFNYTPRCVYERAWNRTTMACRGLILDAGGYVKARPFAKFWGFSEHQNSSLLPRLPVGEPFEAFEKLDGSLGVAFRNPESGDIEIATRGAFMSDQAVWASEWWRERHGYLEIPEGQTWLFEIIYPQNRIVVDYGNRQELVLLAALDNATGRDLTLPENWPGAAARRYAEATVEELTASVKDPQNFEGFVLRYPSTGQRVKVKLDEYLRLHRVLTQCSSKTIWELLSSGQGLTDVLDRVPDEFMRWVNTQAADMLRQYREIDEECRRLVPELAVPGDRKATALKFTQQKHPSVLFKLLDGKDPAPLIWKLIKPDYERPFVTTDVEA